MRSTRNVSFGGIVFPLGPQLRLSWATCRLDARDDGTRIYRCGLKPGFVFQTWHASTSDAAAWSSGAGVSDRSA